MSARGLGDSPRILVARPDRIGDVVLSTPAFRAIRRAYPRARVTVAVRSLVAPLLAGLDSIDELLIFDPDGEHAGLKGFARLVRRIREGRYDAAVILQSHRRLSLAIRAAGVPVRAGPLSRPHSYLCFNRGIRQRRSQVRMHEAEYNLELLRGIGIQVRPRELATEVSLPLSARQWAEGWLEDRVLASARVGRIPRLVAIHPGMGGSALNWPEASYRALAQGLLERGLDVVLTAGPSEGTLVRRIAEGVAGQSKGHVPIVYEAMPDAGDSGLRSIHALAAIFSKADLVVAPSTGPLHVAVALGRPVISFYPAIRVQSVERWGPYYPPGRQFSSVFVPEVKEGEDPADPATMSRISVESVLSAVEKLFSLSENRRDG